MSSTYSEYLRLELIGTGEQTGTWGNTTNTNLGTLLDQAVAGTATIDVTLGDVTLTALNGASDQSRQAILKITGTPIAARNVIAPEQSKWYLISNECGQTITLKGASTTGYAIATGETLLMFWNGTDFVPGSSTALGYTPVNKAGDTMSGALYLPATTPTLATQATTKAYVDGAVSGAVGSNFVLKTGDTMTGALTLSGAPTTSLQAATKGYVDSSISGAGYATQSWVTSQNYANTTTQSLVYYYTKTDSDSRYVSVNTQALTYYPLTTTVASTYGALSGNNGWSGVNIFSGTFALSGTGTTLSGDGSSQISLNVGGGQRVQVYSGQTNFNNTVICNSPTAEKIRAQSYNFTATSSMYYLSSQLFISIDGTWPWSLSNAGIMNITGKGYQPGGGAWGDNSDSRLKENVTPLTGALNKLCQLRPVSYEWKYDRENVSNVGFIAQEVAPVFPLAVTETDPTDVQKPFIPEGDKVKNIGWQNDMFAYLVGAVQELNNKITALEEVVVNQQTEINALKAAK